MKYNILHKNRSGIYIITNFVDSRIYIGSSKNLYKRHLYHREDLIKNKHHNKHLQRFVNKYGIEKLSFDLLEYCEKEFLFEREQYFLDNYDKSTTRFNLSGKAIGGFEKHSEESKLKMSLKRRGVKKGRYSYKYRMAISDGQKKSLLSKAHLIEIQKNRVKTYLFKNPKNEPIEITNLKKFCEENGLSDTKMVSVYMGRRVSHNGWVKFDGRERKRQSHCRIVCKSTLDNVFIEKYPSLTEASKSVGTTNERAISNCANGKRPSYKGFVWYYEK